MKILIITNTDSDHVRLVYLIKELLSRGEEVHLMCSGSSEEALRAIHRENIKLYAFPVDTKRFSNFKMFRYGMFFLTAKGKIEETIDEIKPDVVYAYNLLSGYPTMKALKDKNIKFFFDMTDFFHDIFRMKMNLNKDSFIIKRLRKMEVAVINNADKVFTVSNSFRNAIMGMSDKKKEDIIVVHEGANPEVFKPMEKDAELVSKYGLKDKIVITFIGGIEKHDNLDMVVEAGKKLCHENRKVKFLIVGDGGYLPAVKEKVKEEGLDEEFAFTGWVPFKIINTYLSLADIAILVYSNTLITRYVGTTKLYEYLASGIPVVVHDLPGTREVLEDGYGLLFPCDNTEEFTNQLRKLIENESLREELSKKGRKLIIDKFNVLNQSKKMVDAMKV